jgi:hypothetical protein
MGLAVLSFFFNSYFTYSGDYLSKYDFHFHPGRMWEWIANREIGVPGFAIEAFLQLENLMDQSSPIFVKNLVVKFLGQIP